jgi:spermidine synthase
MAVGFQHPKVKVHVGDGFKFLDDYKNEFDVIITDSSDPEGPAESLFQKPYFELLFGALKEGGVITTQGCTFSYISVDLVISLYIYFCAVVLQLRASCFLALFEFQSWRCIAFCWKRLRSSEGYLGTSLNRLSFLSSHMSITC